MAVDVDLRLIIPAVALMIIVAEVTLSSDRIQRTNLRG